MWADERFFFLSLSLPQDGDHWYVRVKQHAKAFSAKPPSSFLCACHCQHIPSHHLTLHRHSEVYHFLRCTRCGCCNRRVSHVETRWNISTKTTTTTEQKESTAVWQSCQTKPTQLTGGTYQRISIWRWQPDKLREDCGGIYSEADFALCSLVFHLLTKLVKMLKSTVIRSDCSQTRRLWFTFLKFVWFIFDSFVEYMFCWPNSSSQRPHIIWKWLKHDTFTIKRQYAEKDEQNH